MKVATPDTKSVRCTWRATTERNTGNVQDSEAMA